MRRVIITAAVFLTLAVGTLSVLVLRDASATSPEDLRTCIGQNATLDEACAEKKIRALFGAYSAANIMDAMQASFSVSSCHVVGHVVGKELLLKTGSVETAIAECSSACTSACIHGIVGAAFAGVPDVRASLEELQHPNLDIIRSEGLKLCFQRETCHAIGHILFQLFEALDPALAECKRLSQGKEPWSCYRGVFMENNMAQSALTIHGKQYPNYRDPTDLLSPCMTVGIEYRHACFHFLALNQQRTFVEKGITDPSARHMRIEACKKVEPQSLKDACFEGVGFSLYFLEKVSLDGARAACEGLERVSERAACAFGFSYHLASFSRTKDVKEFCGRLQDERVTIACYQAAFDSSRNIGSLDPATFCNGAEATCKTVLEAYLTDPTDMIFMWQ